MPLLTSASNSAVKYNSEYFEQAEIDALLKLRPPELPEEIIELRMLPLFETPAFKLGDAEALFNADATEDALQQSLALLMEDPDFKREIDKSELAALQKDAKQNLFNQLKSNTINETVVDNNKVARESVQLVTDADGVVALEVGNIRLLSVNPKLLRGTDFNLVMQIAAVVLDIFALICTAIGIAIEHGSGWIKRIAAYLKGIGQSMLDWAGKMLGKVGTWFSELRSAHGGPEWLTKVKNFGKQIVNFVINAFKIGWKNKNFIKSIRYCFTCLFAGSWLKKAYYMLQLIASIILMIGTAGSSLALILVLAVVQLALFIWDSIVLEQMLHPKQKTESLPA